MSFWFSLVSAPRSALRTSSAAVAVAMRGAELLLRDPRVRDHGDLAELVGRVPRDALRLGQREQRDRRAGSAVGRPELRDPDDLVLLAGWPVSTVTRSPTSKSPSSAARVDDDLVVGVGRRLPGSSRNGFRSDRDPREAERRRAPLPPIACPSCRRSGRREVRTGLATATPSTARTVSRTRESTTRARCARHRRIA